MQRLHHPLLLGILMLLGGGSLLNQAAQVASAAPGLSITGTSMLPDGTGGSFDILLTNPGGTQHIGAYNAAFSVTPQSGASGGIIFGTPTMATTNPLFPGQVPFPDVSSGKIIGATDSDATSPFFIVGGDNTRLFHQPFTFSPGSVGKFDIGFLTTGPFTTSLTDASTNGPIAGLTETGTTVTAPEPAAMSLIMLSGAAMILHRKRRHIA